MVVGGRWIALAENARHGRQQGVMKVVRAPCSVGYVPMAGVGAGESLGEGAGTGFSP